MERAVAVIDIGMTNKKVALYDLDLKPISTVRRVFEPLRAGGIETHDLAAMEEWFLDSLADAARRFDIRAIAVSTHGATMVCTDSSGNPVAPCIYYTHEPDTGFHDRFYGEVGAPEALQAVTGTPDLASLINPAKGLFFLREKFPGKFARAEIVLPYPQYWGMRFTGNAGAEGTYIGCHTYLWDWTKERYSSVAERLGVADKLPPKLRDSWSVLGRITQRIARRTGLSADTLVTMGIHDSNASLLPYLVKYPRDDFVLNSTGSWCVLMHPQEHYGFAPEELGKVVFFNRSAYNKPVKTAIFTGGLEYEAWSKLIAGNAAGIFAKSAALCEDPGDDAYPPILSERSAFILPELVPGSGQFPGSRARAVEDGREYAFADMNSMNSGKAVPGFMRNPDKAMAALDLSLAIQTLVALERAGLRPGAALCTEGGFRANSDYNRILAAALPENSVYLTDMAEATSFGAAMTAIAAVEGCSPDALADRFEIEKIPVVPMEGLGAFDAYRRTWLDLASKNRDDAHARRSDAATSEET